MDSTEGEIEQDEISNGKAEVDETMDQKAVGSEGEEDANSDDDVRSPVQSQNENMESEGMKDEMNSNDEITEPSSRNASRKPSETQDRPATNVAEDVAEYLSRNEQLCASGYSREQLIDVFTEAIKKIESGHQKSSYCPVCSRRKLPEIPDRPQLEPELQDETMKGHVGAKMQSTENAESVKMPREVFNMVPSRDATEKKLELWLRNSTTHRPYMEVDSVEAEISNDGFARLFSRVAIDYRMNIIRGICGRICVDYDVETGLATAFSEHSDKWRFHWRVKLVKGSRPIVVTDEGIKERMVVALCREMRNETIQNENI